MKEEEIRLNIVEIPDDNSKLILERLKPFVEKYNRQQLLEFKVMGFKNDFNLKELLLSCYTQGLVDGEQLNKK